MPRKPDDFQWQPLPSEWAEKIRPLLARGSTPFYLFSADPITDRLVQLTQAMGKLPVTSWLSLKTQPLPPLLHWWRNQGRPVEVVSEWELLMALRVGFEPSRILVNGPGKHQWLGRHPLRKLNVNFDSLNEIVALSPLAKKLQWRCGVRIHTSHEFDPETPEYPTQFGLDGEALKSGATRLKRAGIVTEVVHFHLRTNLSNATFYHAAATEALALCREVSIHPTVLDLGGGYPASEVYRRNGAALNAEFSLEAMTRCYQTLLRENTGLESLWVENGRWLTAGSGVLVVKVIDTKERRGMRHLICDGGRTQHALLSIWEHHLLSSLPARRGDSTLTTITGPTCMAFDRIARLPLPRGLRVDDVIVWQNAGAYHLPWETRFSHGLATVYWNDDGNTREVRPAETFENWWSQWHGSENEPSKGAPAVGKGPLRR